MKRFRCHITAWCAALLLSVLCGCHHPDAEIPEEHPEPWTPSEVENLLGGSDPWEHHNRIMFSCTDFAMNYIADPLGRFYATIFPRPFIEHLQNVCTNLEYPAHAVSCMLQGEWGGAGDDSLRFLINTTIGVAGIFDAAEYFFHIPPSRADFGQTFAVWGIGPGNTYIFPFMPVVNGRDLLGYVFDTVLDIKTYIPYAGYATALNNITLKQESYFQITDGALDPYKNFRQTFLLYRELSIRLWFYHEAQRQLAYYKARQNSLVEPPALCPAPPAPDGYKGKWVGLPNYYSQGALIDSIRAAVVKPEKSNDYWYMRLSLFNSDFINKASMRKIRLEEGREKMVYAFWKAPDAEKTPQVRREKLLLLLPGIGSQCSANMVAAIAEKFNRKGYHVAAFDSAFNWRFICADDPARLPGYLPDDAVRVRRQLAAALKDLKEDGKISDSVPPVIVLAGYSLGGVHTLKIAELEEKEPQLGISRYLAINPPVSTIYAMNRIDELVASTAGWTKSDMLDTLTRVMGPVFLTLTQNYPAYNPKSPKLAPMRYQMPVTINDAKFVVGLNLKLSMRDLLFASHREKALPGVPAYDWGKRNAAYLAIDRITMKEYAEKLLAPHHPEATLDELYRACTLFPLETMLKENPKIRMIHSFDDVLLLPEHRRWLDEAMGEKIVWLSNGGHLGNLYYEDVTRRIVEVAEEAQMTQKVPEKTKSAKK